METTEKKPYLIRRIQFNRAVDKNLIPPDSVIHAGSWWVVVAFTDAQRDAYAASRMLIKPYENQPL